MFVYILKYNSLQNYNYKYKTLIIYNSIKRGFFMGFLKDSTNSGELGSVSNSFPSCQFGVDQPQPEQDQQLSARERSSRVATENLIKTEPYVAHTQPLSLGLKRFVVGLAAAAFSPIIVIGVIGLKIFNKVEKEREKIELKKAQVKLANIETMKTKVNIDKETTRFFKIYNKIPNLNFKPLTEKPAGSLDTDNLVDKNFELLQKSFAERYSKERDISYNPNDEQIDKVLSLLYAFKTCLDKNVNRINNYEIKEGEYFAKIEAEIKILTASRASIGTREKALKNIESLLKQCAWEVAGVNKKSFQMEFHKARGIYTPAVLEKIVVKKQGANDIKEVAVRHNHDASVDYLTKRNATKFKTQIEFMKENSNFLRVSQYRMPSEAQGMSPNALEHSLTDGTTKRSVFRSGAFAVHGQDGVRIEALKKEKDEAKTRILTIEGLLKTGSITKERGSEQINIDKTKILMFDEQIKGVKEGKNLGIDGLNKKLKEFEAQFSDGVDLLVIDKQLRKELGFANLQELRAEISTRRDFCISQALPELIASVLKSAETPDSLKVALATGSFLHVAEGLLSHLNGKERAMIEDMKATLDYLSENCIIEFLKTGEQEVAVGYDEGDDAKLEPKITLKLLIPENANDEIKKQLSKKPEKPLRLTAICFNTAVNEQHTIRQIAGIFLPGEYQKVKNYQNEIVEEGLGKLYDYHALASQKLKTPIAEESMRKLKDHYSKEGNRDTKDIKGVELRFQATRELGGQESIKCKSGKDRTGVWVSNFLALQFANMDQYKERIKAKLLRGLSHYLTGVNTGKPKNYAFNRLQRLLNPDVPPSELCGPLPT